MKRRFFLPFPCLLLISAPAFGAEPESAKTETVAEKGPRILFFSKSSGFEHEVISWKKGRPSFAENQLEKMGRPLNWRLTFSKDGALFSGPYLKNFDAVMFYTSGDLTTTGVDGQPAMTPEGKQALLDWVEAGGAFIGVHSATATYHTNNVKPNQLARYQNQGEKADPYIKLIGAEFIGHGAQQEGTLLNVSPDFDPLRKTGESVTFHEEWYSMKDFAPDLHALLVQKTEGMKGFEYERPPFPNTWLRLQGSGRVFYTALGHREDVWESAFFHDLLTGGVRWALGEIQAETKSNLRDVTPGAGTNPPPPKNLRE